MKNALPKTGNPAPANRAAALHLLWVGLPLVLIAAGLAFCFDTKTDAANVIRSGTYQYLQQTLVPRDTKGIQVVDISDMLPVNGVTPRQNLVTLLRSMTEDPKPLAIGFDIDFSPENDRFVAGDVEFFTECLKNKDTVPVYVGFHRTLGANSQTLLGFPAFSGLAATLLFPADAEHFVTRLGTEGDKGAKSMVSVLSDKLSDRLKKNAEGGMVHRIFPCKMEKTDDIGLRSSLIDFSALRAPAIQTSSYGFGVIMPDASYQIKSYDRERMKDAVVLVGDVSGPQAGDVFPNPMGGGRLIPGVILQALGIYSATSDKLCEVQPESDFFIDLFLGITGVMIQFIAVWRLGEVFKEERLEKLVALALTATVVAFGLSVHVHHIFWTGFVAVALALFIHPSVNSAIKWSYQRGKPIITREVWRYLKK